jgi:hypothetical protein
MLGTCGRPWREVLPRVIPAWILVIVIVAASVGCRHRPSSEAAAPAAASAGVAAPAVASLDDPCTLLTDGDVADVLKLDQVQRKVVPTTFEMDLGSGKTTSSGKACSISANDRGHQNIMVFSISYGTEEDFLHDKAREVNNVSADLLPGIGDRAFWNSGTYTGAALVGARAVIVGGAFDRDAAAGLLERAVARLPAGR